MGADIHFHVEKFSSDINHEGLKDIVEERNDSINNILETEEKTEINPRWIPVGKYYVEIDGNYEYIYNKFPLYSGRNYSLFSVLANVRNYNNNIIPISCPRGVPTDAHYTYKRIVDQYGSDGHSHSYFTLRELKESDINWISMSNGYLDYGNFNETITKMEEIESDTDKIRCLFYFDN